MKSNHMLRGGKVAVPPPPERQDGYEHPDSEMADRQFSYPANIVTS